MNDARFQPGEMRRRHLILVVAAALLLGMFMLMGSQVGNSEPEDDSLISAADLRIGDCFLYPGNDVEPDRVRTTDCSLVHYAEVFGTTDSGNDDGCVDIFDAYVGVDYWESTYIMGFIDIEGGQMLCYLYAAEDFGGSLAAG